VAAALPGGDPLAAALAAGETPSPQMIAAAGDLTGMSPRIGIACLAFIVAGLAAVWAIGVKVDLLEVAGTETTPEVLRHKARMVLTQLGYTDKAADSVEGFDYETQPLNYAEKQVHGKPDWPSILSKRPRVLVFWYRESPQAMTPAWWRDANMTPGIPQQDEPSRDTPGMTFVKLDDQARLTYFEAIPHQTRPAGAAVAAANWDELFKLAELDKSQFQPAEAQWTSPGDSDERTAWTGVYPGTAIPLRIEAAAWMGKPVLFRLISPWTKPAIEHTVSATETVRILIFMFMGTLMFLVPGFLAWRNIKRGKADRTGAMRLSVGIFAACILMWILRAHFAAGFGEFALFVLALSSGLFNATVIWTTYLALEPYVRRHWPHSIISYTRLMNGKFRDPAIGRDALYGVVMGTLWLLIFAAKSMITRTLGAQPSTSNANYLEGARATLGEWLIHVPESIRGTLMFFFILFILRVLLRNRWLAAGVFVALWTLLQSLGSSHPAIEIPTEMAIYGIAAFSLTRFGLVTLAAAVFTTDSIGGIPITANPSIWYFGSTVFAFSAVFLLAVWAFHAATAGRKLFAADIFE
jgi:serine/threonine-protein kinase